VNYPYSIALPPTQDYSYGEVLKKRLKFVLPVITLVAGCARPFYEESTYEQIGDEEMLFAVFIGSGSFEHGGPDGEVNYCSYSTIITSLDDQIRHVTAAHCIDQSITELTGEDPVTERIVEIKLDGNARFDGVVEDSTFDFCGTLGNYGKVIILQLNEVQVEMDSLGTISNEGIKISQEVLGSDISIIPGSWYDLRFSDPKNINLTVSDGVSGGGAFIPDTHLFLGVASASYPGGVALLCK
jgi:hypothetical protein